MNEHPLPSLAFVASLVRIRLPSRGDSTTVLAAMEDEFFKYRPQEVVHKWVLAQILSL